MASDNDNTVISTTNGEFKVWKKLILDKLDSNGKSVAQLNTEIAKLRIDFMQSNSKLKLHMVETENRLSIKISGLDGKIKIQKKAAAVWATIGGSITGGVSFLTWLTIQFFK